MIQLVAHHVALTGPAVRARLTTGEVVATVSNDALRAGGAFDITATLAGAVASYFVVAIVLLSTSTRSVSSSCSAYRRSSPASRS
jgi:hypothetical protein